MLDTEIIQLLWHLHFWLENKICCTSWRVFIPKWISCQKVPFESQKCQHLLKTLCRLDLVIFNKVVLDSPLISRQPLADPCKTSCCISHIFKHAHPSLWHFIFPLRQGHSEVIWKDRRRDSASSAAQTGIKSLGPAALLMDEGCRMFSHITVRLIKAHPWVL